MDNTDNLIKSQNKVDGEIWVTEFTMENALCFREDLLSISKLDPSCPIIIYIHSYGGAVDALASMIETLEEIPNTIITVCHGMAMSCGAILLSHGDIRFCGKHSRVMVHEVSSGTIGNVHDMHVDTAEAKRLNKHFLGLLAKNCGIKGGYDGLRKILKNKDGRDQYMTAEEAKAFGLVDIVGTPHVDKALSYQISTTQDKRRVKTKNAKLGKKIKNPKR